MRRFMCWIQRRRRGGWFVQGIMAVALVLSLGTLEWAEARAKHLVSRALSVSLNPLTSPPVALAAASGVASAVTSAVIDVPDLRRFGAFFAISDVHGMYPELVRLLQAGRILDSQLNWSAGRSLLVVVGDSIDKGPQSIEVLRLWMKLQAQAPSAGGAVVHLLGNHEAEFLADPSNDRKAQELRREMERQGIALSELTDPSRPMGAFLRSMPVAGHFGRWLFAHAGYFPESSWQDFARDAQRFWSSAAYNSPFFIGSNSVLEAKDWWVQGSDSRSAFESRLAVSGLSGVVFGHQPGGLNVTGSCAISLDRRLIKIDNGMAPQAGAHSGSLLYFPRATDLMGDHPPEVHMILANGKLEEVPGEVAEAAVRGSED